MAKSRESKIELTAYDDLFQTDESREEARLSKIRDIPIAEIDEFPDHPFKVLMNEDMEQLVDSIKRNGVMTPATVRLKEDGRYELISGHRRKKACELAGLETLKCEVKELTRDEAIIIMVESNLQRSTILPSEKAFAYKMRLEAMNRQGKRTDLTCSPMGNKLQGVKSSDELAEKVGESKNQIFRYIRLTELVPEILSMVDERQIAFRPAVEISYLSDEQQYSLLEAMASIVKRKNRFSVVYTMDHKIILGVAPTRRGGVFVNPDALKQKEAIYQRLRDLHLPRVEVVDIEDVNEEGLLMGKEDVPKVIEKFKARKVNALFFPHCNFGSEHSVAKVAAALRLPVLLWGPRDEAPEADGSRLRDTQCGLFATGKVLRRMNVPFTYLPNCRVGEPLFKKGMATFLSAANVVKEFRQTRILQISVRPDDFWTMMCNEGELLEKFGIQIFPVSISDLVQRVHALLEEDPAEVRETVAHIYAHAQVQIEPEAVRKLACLKTAVKAYALENDCNAVALQCWYALQKTLGVMPCLANALLTEEGIPVACETDIHGAISSVLLQAAGRGMSPSFFVDWSVRHPDNPNGELLQHCGPWPLSLAKEKPVVTKPFAFSDNCPGAVVAECKGGEITLLRFDGDHGEYGLLLGTAKGIEGPHNHGTYLWVEVPNWPRVESMIVKGPYVHHATALHGNLLPALYAAADYLPALRLDFYDETQKRDTENHFFS